MLSNSCPRRTSSAGEKRPVLVFTDGAWESGVSGLGAVIVDPVSESKHVLSGEVPQALHGSWKAQVGDQFICQIELYAMVVMRWQFRSLLSNRRVIWFVGNAATRFSTIKGMSSE